MLLENDLLIEVVHFIIIVLCIHFSCFSLHDCETIDTLQLGDWRRKLLGIRLVQYWSIGQGLFSSSFLTQNCIWKGFDLSFSMIARSVKDGSAGHMVPKHFFPHF